MNQCELIIAVLTGSSMKHPKLLLYYNKNKYEAIQKHVQILYQGEDYNEEMTSTLHRAKTKKNRTELCKEQQRLNKERKEKNGKERNAALCMKLRLEPVGGE